MAYQPPSEVGSRVQAYADATRLRLAYLYGCRPDGVVPLELSPWNCLPGIVYVSARLARIGLPVGWAHLCPGNT